MKIEIRDGGEARQIPLPTSLVLNKITAHFIAKSAFESGNSDEKKALSDAILFLKNYAKKHKDFVFAEVEEEDGDGVRITL